MNCAPSCSRSPCCIPVLPTASSRLNLRYPVGVGSMLKIEPRETQVARSFIPVAWPAAPYKGLNYYTAADAPVFAEREDDIESCSQIVGPFSTRILLLHGR